MRKNVGLLDGIIGAIFAATIGILYLTGIINGTAAIIPGVFAVLFLATSTAGFCPLYLPIAINTDRGKNSLNRYY